MTADENIPFVPEQEKVPELLPPKKSGSVGPIIGSLIILVLLVAGALYFWGAHLNSQNAKSQLPLIPAGTTTIIISTSTTSTTTISTTPTTSTAH
jgi:hypothetical protein